MAKQKTDAKLRSVIGTRGENIFNNALLDYSQFACALFRARFLGETWPGIDFFVQLENVRGATPFFLAQVRTTRDPFPHNAQSLDVSLPPGRHRHFPGPTYLAGVHEPSRRAFILAITSGAPHGVYQIPVQYELTPANLLVLYNEVRDFWATLPHKPQASHFS
jgi:hypothetical protein